MIITRNILKNLTNPFTKNIPIMSFCSDNDFKKQTKVQLTDQTAQQLIKKWVTEYPIVLFMKGTPQSPRCGYSGHVVQILKKYGLFQYKSVNVLENHLMREQVKIYSKWPTFPQLFVKGQLIGGADIVSQMHKDNTLKELLEQNNLI